MSGFLRRRHSPWTLGVPLIVLELVFGIFGGVWTFGGSAALGLIAFAALGLFMVLFGYFWWQTVHYWRTEEAFDDAPRR